MKIKILLASVMLTVMAQVSYAESTADVVCSYAPSQSARINQIITGLGGAGIGAAAILQATGLQFVAHSSGGYILTGSGGYVAGTLLSPLVAPTVIFATVAVAGTVVVVELSCAPRNHPDAIRNIKNITANFNNAVRDSIHDLNSNAILVRDDSLAKVRELNEDAIVIRDHAFKKAKNANERAIIIRDKFFAGVF